MGKSFLPGKGFFGVPVFTKAIRQRKKRQSEKYAADGQPASEKTPAYNQRICPVDGGNVRRVLVIRQCAARGQAMGVRDR